MTCPDNKSNDSYFDTYDPMEFGDSEFDGHEKEDQIDEENKKEEVLSGVVNNDAMKLREEIERIKRENKTQKEQLSKKDEEKREVIRQLNLAIDMVKEKNVKLRKRTTKESPKKSSPSEFHRLKGMFRGKSFNGFPKSRLSVVAL